MPEESERGAQDASNAETSWRTFCAVPPDKLARLGHVMGCMGRSDLRRRIDRLLSLRMRGRLDFARWCREGGLNLDPRWAEHDIEETE